MKRKMKCVLVLILTMVLIMVTVTPAVASTNSPKKIDYVALGDSGAAGVRAMPGQIPGWEEGSDYGYTDNIARWLAFHGVLGKFNEDYSISGNTAARLADMTSTKEAQRLLKKAEIVTITIGANDLIQPLYDYFFTAITSGQPIDPHDPNLLVAINDIIIDIVGPGGIEMKENFKKVLKNTLHANPDVRIYVMGYYNPLPFLVDFGIDAAPYVMLVNDLIKEAITLYPEASIEYIDTLGIINGITPTVVDPYYTYASGPEYAYGALYNYPIFPFGYKYLYVNLFEPIADIHLTMLGYLKVAQSFIAEINEDFNFIP